MNKKKQPLFNEFPPVPRSDWEAQITSDLKGADYEKKLVWSTLENFKVQPYYRNEDLNGKEYLVSPPGDAPYVRGYKVNSNDWQIQQEIVVENIQAANETALFILDRGIDSIGFVIGKNQDILKPSDALSNLIKSIPLNKVALYFDDKKNATTIINGLIKEVEKRNLNVGQISGAVNYDPLGFLTENGNFLHSEQEDFKTLKEFIAQLDQRLPNYRVLCINGKIFGNAGSTIVQEVAFSISMAADYMSRLTEVGINAESISKHLQFNLSISSNYFMEIAKIRAMRLLWYRVMQAFNPVNPESGKTIIHSVTTGFNQTIYDPYVNVLRATTEAMAAVIGGTDSLTVQPFTSAFKPANNFSNRVSRNIQIILKEEAYLGRIVDPSAGSYYIENLTDSIIQEAWNLFLKIEEMGGYLEALKKNFIQDQVNTSVGNRKKLIATRKEILLGTNQYPDARETVNTEIVAEITFPEINDKKTLTLPINPTRGSIDFEKLRLSTETNPGGVPKVFMFTIGNPVMRKARAGFSAGFFSCAGYKIIDNPGFSTLEEGLNTALKEKADIIVLCSSDEEYADLAPKLFKSLQNKAILVVAGAPECMDELKSQGIQNFIHMRSNLLETLKDYHKMLNIQ